MRARRIEAGLSYPKRRDDLQSQPAEEGCLIHEPERDRVHDLNHTAVLVLELCTGAHSPAEQHSVERLRRCLRPAPRLDSP